MNIKKDFPFFTNNPHLTYLDSAATTQKPQNVIEAITHFYAYNNAPVHRGIYQLAEKVTAQYEGVREQIRKHLNACDTAEIIFTKGTTESINIIATSWASHTLQEGDEIVLSPLEHHANMVPWLMLAQQKKILIKWIPVKDGLLDESVISSLITARTKLLALSNNSNIFGYALNVEPFIRQAKKVGARVLVDAAQAIARSIIDVRALNCDFLAFSGHKMLGPTGIGVLYINRELHEYIIPYQLGGSMVYEVSFERASWRPLPHRLEAGTPPVAQVIGLGAALKYIQQNIDFHELQKCEAQLCTYMIDELKNSSRIKILGNLQELKKTGHLVSFLVDEMHPHDVAALLDQRGICVRAGHHCAQPLHTLLNLPGSVRASFYGYTTNKDIEKLVKILTLPGV